MDHPVKVATVNTLEGNRPQYRLGDAVLCRNRLFGKQAYNMVAENPAEFEGTVLYEYTRRADPSIIAPQWDVLREIVAEKSVELGIGPRASNELVIHLRMGDRKGFKQPFNVLTDYVISLIEQLDNPVGKISLVTAIHFGGVVIRNRMSREKLNIATRVEAMKVKKIIADLTELGLDVRLQSSEDIDRDFCFLAAARRLVLGNGHFSLCAAMVSDAECFVPTWSRRGSRANIDKLLASREIPNPAE